MQDVSEVYDDFEPNQGVINGIFKSLEDPYILNWRAFSKKRLRLVQDDSWGSYMVNMGRETGVQRNTRRGSCGFD